MFCLTHLAGCCIQKGQHCSSASCLTLSLVLDEVTMEPFEGLDLLAACAGSVLVSWFQIGSNLEKIQLSESLQSKGAGGIFVAPFG